MKWLDNLLEGHFNYHYDVESGSMVIDEVRISKQFLTKFIVENGITGIAGKIQNLVWEKKITEGNIKYLVIELPHHSYWLYPYLCKWAMHFSIILLNRGRYTDKIYGDKIILWCQEFHIKKNFSVTIDEIQNEDMFGSKLSHKEVFRPKNFISHEIVDTVKKKIDSKFNLQDRPNLKLVKFYHLNEIKKIYLDHTPRAREIDSIINKNLHLEDNQIRELIVGYDFEEIADIWTYVSVLYRGVGGENAFCK